MRNGLFVLGIVIGSMLGTSCAHVSAIEKDVRSCITAEGPQALKDLEKQVGPLIENVLMCEVASGAEAPPDNVSLNPNAIPACVYAGLESVAIALGPDGERFRLCVVNAIEMDPLAAPKLKARARTVRMKLVASSNGR